MVAEGELDGWGASVSSEAFVTALNAATRGLKSFPCHTVNADGSCTCGKSECRRPGKHPLTGHGLHDASCDEKTLLHWNDQFPHANWALACGDDVAVIDADPKHGADPSELIDEHGLAQSSISETGEWEGVRGAHIYRAGPVPTGSAPIPGVHIRGQGSYVMLPGSRHWSGVSYRWANGRRPWSTPLEALPGAFMPRRKGTGGQERAPERVPHAERHQHLVDFAVRLARAGVTDVSTLLAHTETEFRERCELEPDPEPGSLRKIAEWAAETEIAGRERRKAKRRFGGPSRRRRSRI